jgi:hypothetical protein
MEPLACKRGGTVLNRSPHGPSRVFGKHFIVWKLSVIGTRALTLCLLSRFRAAKAALCVAVALCGGIVCYQPVLMSFIPDVRRPSRTRSLFRRHSEHVPVVK